MCLIFDFNKQGIRIPCKRKAHTALFKSSICLLESLIKGHKKKVVKKIKHVFFLGSCLVALLRKNKRRRLRRLLKKSSTYPFFVLRRRDTKLRKTVVIFSFVCEASPFLLRVKSSCYFLVAFLLRDTKSIKYQTYEKSCYLFFCMLPSRAFFFKGVSLKSKGC